MHRTPDRLRWPHFLLAALVYFALLLAWAPASLVAWALPRLTQQAVWVEQTEGSVWHGQAAGVRLHTAAAGSLQLGRVNWQLRPLDLFAGQIGYLLELSGAGIDAMTVLRTSVVRGELKEARAELAAEWLERLSPDLGLWQPGGRLVFETDGLAFSGGKVDGQATIRWLHATSGRASRPLGNYRANLEGVENALNFKLSTESGALHLHGTGSWNRQHGLAFIGTARAAPDVRAELEGLLSQVGQAQPNGEYAIRIGR